MRRLFFLLVFLLFAFLNTALAADIEGVVTAEGKPAANAMVILMLKNKEAARTITGNDGRYYIRKIAANMYTVRILWQKIRREYTITVAERVGGDHKNMNFSL
jgi:hypothetical protein